MPAATGRRNCPLTGRRYGGDTSHENLPFATNAHPPRGRRRRAPPSPTPMVTGQSTPRCRGRRQREAPPSAQRIPEQMVLYSGLVRQEGGVEPDEGGGSGTGGGDGGDIVPIVARRGGPPRSVTARAFTSWTHRSSSRPAISRPPNPKAIAAATATAPSSRPKARLTISFAIPICRSAIAPDSTRTATRASSPNRPASPCRWSGPGPRPDPPGTGRSRR